MRIEHRERAHRFAIIHRQRTFGRRRLLWSLPALGLITALLMVTLLATPSTADAHPLDIYLQASYLTVGPEQVDVELDLTPGVLISPNLLPEIDTDGDQTISEAEAKAYAQRVVDQLALQVDGQPVALSITKLDTPTYLNIQAGYGTIRVFTSGTLPAVADDDHSISYANNYAPTGSAYQVNTFVETGATITLGTQNRDDIQQTLTVGYTVGSGSPAAVDSPNTAAQAAESATGTLGQARRLERYFDDSHLSAWQLMVALGVALMLGGLHAMTPGHGKTLVAAYLVGSSGTTKHAAALGGIVTFTHTASVVVIGLLALFASRFIVPDVLVPALQVVSGVLVVAMGGRLIWHRWLAFRAQKAHVHARDHGLEHSHGHSHGHDHVHADGLTHDHGDGHVYTHLPPEKLKISGLLAMGVSGGLVPCPEALGIMIIAVGLHRIELGLGLIVAFSLGLAAVLIGLGILLVHSRSLVDRVGKLSGRLVTGLPLGSAVLVTVLGAGIMLGGVSSYMR